MVDFECKKKFYNTNAIMISMQNVLYLFVRCGMRYCFKQGKIAIYWIKLLFNDVTTTERVRREVFSNWVYLRIKSHRIHYLYSIK